MKRWLSRRVVAMVVLGILVLMVATSAIGVAGYHLSWYAVSGGGGHLSGGHFAVDSTVGQPVAGSSHAGPYKLCSGYQCGAGPSWYAYLPVINKGG